MAADNAAIVIKKVKKSHAHGHHGGAWKVAYADFVTAMMAFFLLLWLLNATTDEQKQGIADYFTPTSVSQSNSGGGGVLGGQSLSSKGALPANRSAVNLTISLPSTKTPDEMGEYREKNGGPVEAGESQKAQTAGRTEGSGQVGQSDESGQWIDQSHVEEMMARREQERFEAAADALRQAIQSVPDLNQLAEHLMIDQTPEGLRIQIVDRDKLSMFPKGSSQLLEHTRKLMELVVEAIGQLPNRIAIKGHTDATPFTSNNGYSNWELSTDRANASRRALIEAGLPAERIDSVAGRAAEEPLVPEDPTSPRNRRISIILLRNAQDGAAAPDTAASQDGLEVRVETPAD